MVYRQFDRFTSEMLKKTEKFIMELQKNSIRYIVLETWRDPAVQKAYYAQGREDYASICALRKIAGLPPISEREAKNKITKTKFSKHSQGKAIDIVPLLESGVIPWDIKDKKTADLWLRMGTIGESCGLTWGGRWDPKEAWGIGWDPAHYEID